MTSPALTCVLLAMVALFALKALPGAHAQARAVTSHPEQCTPMVDCFYYYSWYIPADDPSVVEISMQAKAEGYIAIGWNTAPKMVRMR